MCERSFRYQNEIDQQNEDTTVQFRTGFDKTANFITKHCHNCDKITKNVLFRSAECLDSNWIRLNRTEVSIFREVTILQLHVFKINNCSVNHCILNIIIIKFRAAQFFSIGNFKGSTCFNLKGTGDAGNNASMQWFYV